MRKEMDRRAISFAKARSSAVMPTSGGGPATVSNGFALDEAREIRLRAPLRRPSLLSALATARLHQTMDKHSTVPEKRG